MQKRDDFIHECFERKLTMTELCAKYGISRKTGYKWRRRVYDEGTDGLLDRTSRPRHNSRSWEPSVVGWFLELRGRRPTVGPKKLRVMAARKFPKAKLPAVSTIGLWLRAHGLAKPRKRKRRATPSSQPFAACTRANALWCADFKGHFPVNRKRCHPLTVMDAHSRFLLVCEGLRRPTLEATQALFKRAFTEFGLPDAIRTDNGAPFASTGLAGLSRLAVWFMELGIRLERIEPGKPQQNARHERMHLTLKQETATPPQSSFLRQQRAFDRWRQWYNHERPHESLGQVPPAEYYQTSDREYEEYTCLTDYPEGYEQRRIQSAGVMHWRGETIFVSTALATQWIGLRETEPGRWIVYFRSVPVGVLDENRKPWRVRAL